MKNKRLLAKVLKKKKALDPTARSVALGLTSHQINLMVYRAPGDKVCDVCNRTYSHHPFVLDEVSMIDGEPYLKVICSGDIVKL